MKEDKSKVLEQSQLANKSCGFCEKRYRETQGQCAPDTKTWYCFDCWSDWCREDGQPELQTYYKKKAKESLATVQKENRLPPPANGSDDLRVFHKGVEWKPEVKEKEDGDWVHLSDEDGVSTAMQRSDLSMDKDKAPVEEVDKEKQKNIQGLVKFLREAIPSWQGGLIAQAMNKLAEVGVVDLPGLLKELEKRTLNKKLLKAGKKAFTADTLSAMRDHAAGEQSQIVVDNSDSSYSHRDNIWQVIGGKDRGGLIVRPSRMLGTARLPFKLSVGSIVKQIELCDTRLFYLLLTGHGPISGWVTTETPDEVYLQRLWSPSNLSPVETKRVFEEAQLRCKADQNLKKISSNEQPKDSIVPKIDVILPPEKCRSSSPHASDKSEQSCIELDPAPEFTSGHWFERRLGEMPQSNDNFKQLLEKRKEDEANGTVSTTRRYIRREALLQGATFNFELVNEEFELLANNVAADVLTLDCESVHGLEDLDETSEMFEKIQQVMSRTSKTEGVDSNVDDDAVGSLGFLNESSLVAAIVAGDQKALLQCIELDDVNVNAQDILGETPLFEAVQNGDVEIVTILLLHGADPRIRSHNAVACKTFSDDPHMLTLIDLFMDRPVGINEREQLLMRLNPTLRQKVCQHFRWS